MHVVACGVRVLCSLAENSKVLFATDAATGRLLRSIYLSQVSNTDVVLDARNYLYVGASSHLVS